MVVEPFCGVTLGDHNRAMDSFHPGMVEKIMEKVSIELTECTANCHNRCRVVRSGQGDGVHTFS